MRQAFKRIDWIIEWIENILCAGTLVAIVCICGAQVILRYAFGASIFWADEVNQALVVAMGVFGCARAVRFKGHTELTLVEKRIPSRKARIGYRLVLNGIALIILIMLFVTSLQHTLNSTVLKSVVLRVPRMYYYMSMPIGLGFTIYEFVKLLRDRIMNDKEEEF